MAGSGTDERSKLPVEMYLLAGGVGFVFGALVSFANAQITRHSVRKNSANAIMAASILRMLVNIAALAVVYFTRNLLPLPFYGTIVGTAVGLSLVGILLNLKLSKEQLKDPGIIPSQQTVGIEVRESNYGSDQ